MNKEEKLTKEYYSAQVLYEWNRLGQDPFHRLEYDTTWRFLKEYLPRKGLVLDAGGGPGRYTIELARLGYNVVLLDLAAENLELGKKEIEKAGMGKRVKEIVEGSITDLSHFKDNSFDAVLCLGGPLSHVHPESERRKAVSELVRVARKNAPIFVSVMSKYGVLLATPEGWPQMVADKKYFSDLAITGDDYRFGHTGFCHFFTSTELRKILKRRNTDIIKMVGLEGFNTDNKTSNTFAEKYPDAWQNWLGINNQMCTDPFVVDASGHMMIIMRKKE
jgi:S-adenosylmethionine-dependent methyltransferase